MHNAYGRQNRFSGTTTFLPVLPSTPLPKHCIVLYDLIQLEIKGTFYHTVSCMDKDITTLVQLQEVVADIKVLEYQRGNQADREATL